MKLYFKFQKQLDDIASKKKTIEMPIPRQFIYHIIGKKGQMIKKIKKISGAEINIDTKDYYRPLIDTSTAIVNITAENSDSLSIAKELINKVISNPTNAMLEMNKLTNHKDQNKPKLETKPKKTRKSRPNQRERAKQSAYEKSAAREQELANNCLDDGYGESWMVA